jgi:hypothetical protein
VTPFRIVDTRTGATDPATYAGKTLAAATSLNVQVTGVGTVPVPATASAAVLNVTAVNTSLPGFLAVYPAGTTQPPLVSNLNFTADETVANLVTVPLSATGMATIYNSAGNTDVLVDVEGYYTSTPPTNGAGLYDSISPVRVLGALDFGATVAANTTVPVTVAGTTAADGVPASAIAVVVSATAAHGTAASFLSVYPAPALTTEPTFSNVNFSAGEAVANRVTVAVGTGGVIEVYNHAGTVDVDIDVDGYYTAVGGTGSVFVPLTTPVRVADTRTASLVGTETPIAPATSELFNLATTASGIPATATSVVANFTVVSGDASGYLSIYPTSTTTHPVSSSVNWTANEIVPDFTIADTNGTGSVEVYNGPAIPAATINLVVDVFGYFETLASGPIMVSAVVTDTSIAITYNQGATCPSVAANLALAFAYDWSGSASGGTVAGCSGGAATTTPDVLTLTPATTFTLPGSTGGSITYTAGAGRATVVADSTLVSVYATSTPTLFSPTQTLPLAASVAPAMVSAYTTATTLVITYNEDVACPAGNTIPAAFAYNYTGVANGFTTLNTACTSAANVLTLTAAVVQPPGSGANVVYTAQASTVTPTTGNSVSATGSLPTLYAATQTLTVFATPAITAAVVTPGASGSILVTYTTGVTMACGTAIQSEFVYSNVGSPAYPSKCVAGPAGDQLTFSLFMTTATGTTAATLSLPGATDTLVYTSPVAPAVATEVHATNVFPQFPATQTFVLGAAAVPAMDSAVVTASTIAITYSEGVTCPATGADGAFVYDYSGASLGGTATGCTTSGAVLTLTGAFSVPAPSATIVYTEPATPTTSNAVTATGTTTDFAATQTLGPSAGILGGFTFTAVPATATPVAGAIDSWTLTATPAVTGTYFLTVTGQLASPNGTAATVPTTAVFTAGAAPVSITLVDAAAQTLVFTVAGATGAVTGAVVTPVAAAVSTAWISGIASQTCTPTFAVSGLTQVGPAVSATQTLTGTGAVTAACTVTATLTALDAYGNTATAPTGGATVTTASATHANFTVATPATFAAAASTTTDVISVVNTAAFTATALTIGTAAYDVVVTVSD